jgi:Uma2 family endonuclease
MCYAKPPLIHPTRSSHFQGSFSLAESLINKPVWTYEDYCVLPQDFNRHEIIEGDHIVTPSPATRHQRVSKNLQFLLESHIRSRDLGVLFAAPTDLLLAPTSVVVPDLLFIRKDRMHIITEANVQGPPDLIVEILSPSTAAIDRAERWHCTRNTECLITGLWIRSG